MRRFLRLWMLMGILLCSLDADASMRFRGRSIQDVRNEINTVSERGVLEAGCGDADDKEIHFTNDTSSIACDGEPALTWDYSADLLTIDPADTTSVAAEEVAFTSAAQTIALSDGTTITNMRQNQFLAPTINGVAAGGTETVTNAATVFIDQAPSGSNITLSNAADLMFGESTSTAVLVTVIDETTSNTNGRRLNITGADGNGSGDGGIIAITSGNGGSSSSGHGGNLNLTSGTAGASDGNLGGDVNITGGNGNGAGLGGDIILTSGDSGAGGTGGNVKILTGVGSSGNSDGGDFQAFLSGGSGTGTGGSIDLEAGIGRASGATGGFVLIQSGGFDADGATGGAVTISALGPTSNKDGNTGNVVIETEDFATLEDGNSGSVTIRSGNTAAGNNTSGDITLRPGIPSGSGTGGFVNVTRDSVTSVSTELLTFRMSAVTTGLASGTTLTTHRQAQFLAPTINGVAGGGAETVTSSATVYIDNDPSGSDITLTDPYALWIDGGDVRTDEHLIGGGTAPTISSCGASPTVAGNDLAGKVTVGGGGAVTSCTVTFANATYDNAPACMCMNETTEQTLRCSTSTTVLTIVSATDFQSDVIAYLCLGYE